MIKHCLLGSIILLSSSLSTGATERSVLHDHVSERYMAHFSLLDEDAKEGLIKNNENISLKLKSPYTAL